MNSMWYDPHFLPRSIFNFFSTGMDREKIIANLLLAQKNFPDLYPCIDYRTVEFWIESFQNKNFDLNRTPTLYPRIDYQTVDFWVNSFNNNNFDFKQTPTHPNIVQLRHLPILDEIIGYLNVEDQKSLSMSCEMIGNFIKTRNRLFESVKIEIGQDLILVEAVRGITYRETQTIFTKMDSGCQVRKRNITPSLLPFKKEYMKAGLDDFKELIGKNHTKIGRLTISSAFGAFNLEDRNKFVYGVAEILSKLDKKIHVEELQMEVKSSEELLAILNEINPFTLSSLILNHCGFVQAVINMETIVALPFWKHLKKLRTDRTIQLNIGLASTTHISRVLISLASIPTVQEVVEHKNKFLEQSTVEYHEFYLRETPMALGFAVFMFKLSLIPFTPVFNDRGEEDPDKIQIRIPGNEEKYLVVCLGETIGFSRR